MAGIAGMGQPKKVPSPIAIPPLPQGANIPPMLAAQPAPDVVNTDLSALAEQAAADVPQPSLDDLANQVLSLDDIAAGIDNTPTEEPTDEAPSAELGTRAQLSFASSDEQKRATLEKSFGTDNVRKVDDLYQVKKEGKWKKVESSTWDLVKSVVGSITDAVAGQQIGATDYQGQLPGDLASNAAPIAKEVAALPAEAVGALGAGPAGFAAARAGAGVATELAATALQGPLGLANPESVLGSDSISRAGINGTIRAAAGFAGDKVATWAARKAESRLANKALLDAIPEQSAINDIKELADLDAAMGALKKEGALDPSFKLRPDQVSTAPELKGAAQQASKGQKFRDLVEKQGEMIYDTALKVLSHAGNVNAKPSEAQSILQSADDVAGKMIGEAREKIKDSVIEGTNTDAVLRAFEDPVEGLGFSTKTSSNGLMGTDTKFGADRKQLEAALGITQRGSLLPARFEKTVQDVKALLVNNGGKLKGEDANVMYKKLVNEINSIKNPDNYAYRAQLIKMKNAIRDDVMGGIETEFGVGDGALYSGSMKRYRAFREAEGTLQKLFDDGEMTTEALSKYVFTKNDKGLERVRTIKKLLNSQNPQAWDDLKGNYIQGLMDNAKITDPAKAKRLGQYDWVKIGDQVQDLGDKVVSELFDTPESVSNFKGFLKIAEKTKVSDFNFETGKQNMALAAKLKSSAGALINSIRTQSAKPAAEAMEMWSHIAPDDLTVKYLNNGGLEEIMKLVPKAEQSKYRTFFDGVVKQYADSTGRRVGQSLTTGAVANDAANAD